jgi:DNA-binding NtrC family response regulator
MSDKRTILIIDDEARDSPRMPKVDQTAENGETGLKMAEALKPDIVFVDLKMPGISGMEVLERLNKVDATIVSVVITGYATIDSAVEAIKKGAYDFLPKPFSADELRLITRRGIEKRILLLDAIALRREKEMIRNATMHELKSLCISAEYIRAGRWRA